MEGGRLFYEFNYTSFHWYYSFLMTTLGSCVWFSCTINILYGRERKGAPSPKNQLISFFLHVCVYTTIYSLQYSSMKNSAYNIYEVCDLKSVQTFRQSLFLTNLVVGIFAFRKFTLLFSIF